VEHPKETVKIQDVIRRGKEEYRNIITQIDTELTKTVQDTRISTSKKKVDEYYLKALKNLENVSGKFEALKDSENKLKDMISKLLTKKIEEGSNNPFIKLVIESKKIYFYINSLIILFLIFRKKNI
jgi:hypothetical protein